MTKTPSEIIARALCQTKALPENTRFEGRSMWESFLPEADAILTALTKHGYVVEKTT